MKKFYISILILITLFAYSCKEEIDVQEISGIWELYYVPSVETQFVQFEIDSNEIILSDEYYLPQKYAFELNSRKIVFQDKFGSNKEISIERIELDTIMTEDSLFYVRNRRLPNSHTYSLSGIKSENVLDKNEYSLFIHYYEYEGIVKLKIGNKYYKFKDLIQFTERSSRKETFTIFLGNKIKLYDLKVLYAYLKYLGWNKVNIVVNVNSQLEYEIIEDTIEIWSNEMSELLEYPLPPPLPAKKGEFISKDDFLKHNPEVIEINNYNDIKKLNNISLEFNYLISINNQIPLKEYLLIKTKIIMIANENKNHTKFEIL